MIQEEEAKVQTQNTEAAMQQWPFRVENGALSYGP